MRSSGDLNHLLVVVFRVRVQSARGLMVVASGLISIKNGMKSELELALNNFIGFVEFYCV